LKDTVQAQDIACLGSDCHSGSVALCREPAGIHDQICCLSVANKLASSTVTKQGCVRCVRCQNFTCFVRIYIFFFVFRVTYLHLLFFVRILYHMYVLSASPIILRKSSFVPLISSYNCCSFIWTVLGLPPLIISPIHLMFWASSCPVLRVFAFACSLFRTTSSCCPHNLVIYPETCGSLKATCKSHPGIPLKNISCGADSHVLQALQVQEAGDRHR